MINFLYIRIKGFGSISTKLKFTFDKPKIGLTVLRGANGVGKTTIFNAFAWVIWGKTIKERGSIETWEDRRPAGYRGAKVEIYYEHNNIIYCITRFKNYKPKGENRIKDGLSFKINNVEQESLRDKKDLQKAINQSLGLSFNVFKNTIMFGQRLKRLIQESNSDKKKIFEEAFNIGYIDKAKKIAEKQKDSLKIKLAKSEGPISKTQETLNQIKAAFEYEKVLALNFVADQNKTIEDLKSQIALITKESQTLKASQVLIPDQRAYFDDRIKKREKRLEELEGISREHFKKTFTRDILEGEIEMLTQTQKNLIGYKQPELCSRCGQKLTAHKIQEQRNLAKSELDMAVSNKALKRVELQNVKTEIENLQAEVNKYKIVREKLTTLRQKKSVHENDLRKADILINTLHNKELEIKALEKLIIQESQKSFNNTERKLLLKQQKYDAKLKLNLLQTEQEETTKEFEIANWLIKNPLGNMGLKTFIFENRLSMLNEQLKAYEPYFGFRVEFGINLDNVYKDFYTRVTRDKIERDYDDLSGGQKQTVDIAIAFAFHDIQNIDNPTNILVFDEIFEGLDKKHIEQVANIIQLKAQEKHVFVITHLDFNPENTNFIDLELDNTTTVVS